MEQNNMLFCTGFLNSDKHIERYTKWLAFYQERAKWINVDYLCIIDDGSSMEWLEKFASIQKLNPNIQKISTVEVPEVKRLSEGYYNILSFPENYGRPVLTLIPGWWRSFSYASIVAESLGSNCLYHIESDAYVLSEEAWRRLSVVDRWQVFWCTSKGYPESAIQWCSNDFLHEWSWYWRLGRPFWWKTNDNGATIHELQYAPEFFIKWHVVHKDLIGDRFGDDWAKTIPKELDFICNTDDISLGSEFQQLGHTKKDDIRALILNAPTKFRPVNPEPTSEDYEDFYNITKFEVPARPSSYAWGSIAHSILSKFIKKHILNEGAITNIDEEIVVLHRHKVQLLNDYVTKDYDDLSEAEQQELIAMGSMIMAHILATFE